MIIIADKRRKDEFSSKMQYSSFRDLNKNNRVKFLDYETLTKQYEQEVERKRFEPIL